MSILLVSRVGSIDEVYLAKFPGPPSYADVATLNNHSCRSILPETALAIIIPCGFS